MAGPAGSKYYDVFLDYNVWLINKLKDEIIGDSDFTLLSHIQSGGSLKAAAENQGISYRKAWGMLKRAEEMLGFKLVRKQRGGKQGGETRLTDDGLNLLQGYVEFHKEIDKAVYKATKNFFRTLNKTPK